MYIIIIIIKVIIIITGAAETKNGLIRNLQVPRPRLEITGRGFLYKGAKVWNDISNKIRNVESAALFKKQVKNYVLGQ